MLKTVVAGGLGGALAGLGIWLVVSRALDKQLTSGGSELEAALAMGRGELESRLITGRMELTQRIQSEVAAQVPQRVRDELESTLRRYNITPDTGRRIDQVLAGAERLGLL